MPTAPRRCAGSAISEGEHEVTLHAERPVVEKVAEPVERVRLTAESTTEEETGPTPLRGKVAAFVSGRHSGQFTSAYSGRP